MKTKRKQKTRKKMLMYFAQLRSVVRFSALLTLSLTLALAAACEEAPAEEAETSAAIEPAEAAPTDPSTADPAAAEPATGPAAAHAHGAPGAAPGSHGDWCGAHAVPESLCTRCNPSLIAAFQATGDWCPEHNLPESQCLICNPELVIERPPLEAEETP